MLAVVVCIAGISSCGSSAQGSQVARDEEVLLAPDVNAGSIGWCMIMVSTANVGGCPTVRSRPRSSLKAGKATVLTTLHP